MESMAPSHVGRFKGRICPCTTGSFDFPQDLGNLVCLLCDHTLRMHLGPGEVPEADPSACRLLPGALEINSGPTFYFPGLPKPPLSFWFFKLSTPIWLTGTSQLVRKTRFGARNNQGTIQVPPYSCQGNARLREIGPVSSDFELPQIKPPQPHR